MREPSDTFAVPCSFLVSTNNHFYHASIVEYASHDDTAKSSTPLTLSHNNTAHEQLNRPDTLERHLALARSLVQTQLVAQLVLAHSVRVVDLVSENEEGHLGEVFHGQEGVQLGLGFREALVVLGVDEKDNAADFGEIVLPETAGCYKKKKKKMISRDAFPVALRNSSLTLLVTAQVEGRKAVVADGQLFRGWVRGG